MQWAQWVFFLFSWFPYMKCFDRTHFTLFDFGDSKAIGIIEMQQAGLFVIWNQSARRTCVAFVRACCVVGKLQEYTGTPKRQPTLSNEPEPRSQHQCNRCCCCCCCCRCTMNTFYRMLVVRSCVLCYEYATTITVCAAVWLAIAQHSSTQSNSMCSTARNKSDLIILHDLLDVYACLFFLLKLLSSFFRLFVSSLFLFFSALFTFGFFGWG